MPLTESSLLRKSTVRKKRVHTVHDRLFQRVCSCRCFCSMKSQAVEGEGENSHAYKGILSAPEAERAATSIPTPPSFLTSLHSSLPSSFSVDLLSSASISWAAQWASAP